MTPRVRFAPSPTGPLHVGNVRTALFNWLFARRHGGRFVLRIEDTDTDRHEVGSEEAIYADLAWLGLDWDEGPVRFGAGSAMGLPGLPAAGGHGPYRQSERGAFYEAALAKLLSKGAVYPCFCSEALLEADRGRSLADGRQGGYTGRCSEIDTGTAAARIAGGEPHALRFRVGAFGVVMDGIRGAVDFSARSPSDPVVRRRDGRPTYNFAVVVDDAAMEITHVLRGEDHLTNTALQLRLYEELDLHPPLFAHLSMILGPDSTPLSKRHGSTSLGEFRRQGYPPEALVNGLALLGWTPPADRVPISREEMVALFDLGRVHANPAIFDVKKLDWISGQVIRAMDRVERGRLVGLSLIEAGRVGPDEERRLGKVLHAWLEELGDLLATSIEHFDQVPGQSAFVFEFDPTSALAHGALEGAGAISVLETFARLLESHGELTQESLARVIEEARKATGLKGRALLHPLRAAGTGLGSGPELSRVLPLIDRAGRMGLARAGPGLAVRIRLVLRLARDAGERA